MLDFSPESHCSKDGLVETMEMLYRMYEGGIAVNLNYSKAAFWAEKIVAYGKRVITFGKKDIRTIETLKK